MHVLYSTFLIFVTFSLMAACGTIRENAENAEKKAKKVEVRKIENKYQLYRNGQPYYIKGAGGYKFIPELKAAGGNSIRTWDSGNAKIILDEAHQLGLTVTVGLLLAREKEGFDYSNEAAVQAQFETLKAEVLKYKDHPALLMWCVGNEIYASSSNTKVWEFVNDVAKMIHEVDPDHPTATALMNAPDYVVKDVTRFCPAIDILFINTYGGIHRVYNEIRNSSWDGPYIVSEYGSQGYWEAPRTSWDVVIEETSNRKAQMYQEHYEKYIKKDEERCMGSYAFYWGHKQERTSTWFNIFTEKGEKTAIADALQYVWTGSRPANQAPFINYVHINNKRAEDNIYLKSDSTYTANTIASDPDNDQLSFTWELLDDTSDLRDGVFYQSKPQVVLASDQVNMSNSNNFVFKAPRKEGPYRLFVYVSDGNKNASTANVPVYVLP